MDNKDLIDGLAVMILASIVILAVTVSLAVGFFFGIGYGFLVLSAFVFSAIVGMLSMFKRASK
ncbi:MAG: hypothetical protein Q4B77_06210 [Coriobacteriaceae bacterium]|jgi:hypothetical protein|nr:hypothetical protein [Coriobacteriaceae bacterium]